ncbi:hypothetical protein [Mycobacteroides abscessus]|nr:hypothetical protein [Mycobacteroides abscessus]
MIAHAVIDAAPTVEFVAGQVRDGTSSNTIGNFVAGLALCLVAVVMGYTLWYDFEVFRDKKGKFSQAVPEILGITACGAFLAYLCTKIPNVFGFGDTFLSDWMPF